MGSNPTLTVATTAPTDLREDVRTPPRTTNVVRSDFSFSRRPLGSHDHPGPDLPSTADYDPTVPDHRFVRMRISSSLSESRPPHFSDGKQLQIMPQASNLRRIGFLTWSDLKGPGAFSGSPWSVRTALERAGHEIVDIEVGPHRLSSSNFGHQKVPALASNRRFRGLARGLFGPLLHRRHRSLRQARKWSQFADAAIRDASPDVIVGVKMSGPIAFLNTELPILYATDATTSLLQEMYGVPRWKGRGWKSAMLELESRTLQRADASVFWFRGLIDRAVEDHGADRSRLHVVYAGSNLTPENDEEKPLRSLPERSDLRILFVGADPVRKQLDVAVDAVRSLRDRGWRATLRYVGPEHPWAKTPEVEHFGRLQLDSTRDQSIHRELLETSHVNLLPTRADMTPLSVNEASRFALPSVVSDVGGLPEQVLDRITGRSLPSNAPATAWADAIEWIIDSPERYRSIAQACRDRAGTKFRWETWGTRVSDILQNLKRA